MTYFVYLLLQASFSLLKIFYYHMHVPLGTYSVHIRPLGDLFCTYGTFWLFTLYTYLPTLEVFSITTTSLWHILYTRDFSAYMWTFLWWPILYTYISDFYGLFCSFSSPWWALPERYSRTIMRLSLVPYSVHMPPFGDLFCTHITQCWLTSFL